MGPPIRAKIELKMPPKSYAALPPWSI